MSQALRQSLTLEQTMQLSMQLLQEQIAELAPVMKISQTDLRSMVEKGSYRLLLVEPDETKRGQITDLLKGYDCIVKAPKTVKEARRCANESRVWDAAVIRFEQQEGDGVALAKEFKKHDPDLPIIVYTSEKGISSKEPEKFQLAGVYQALVREAFLSGPNQFIPLYYQEDAYTHHILGADRTELGVLVQHEDSLTAIDPTRNIDNLRGETIFERERQSLTKFLLDPVLKTLFFNVKLKYKIPILIKVGGSHFDLVEDGLDFKAISDFAADLTYFTSAYPQFAPIVCPGGGHLNDNLKDWIDNPNIKLKPGDAHLEKMAQQILEVQAEKLLGELGDFAYLVDPNKPMELGEITDETFHQHRILLWPYAPREMRRRYHLSMSNSDAQSFGTGALFDVRRALFSKNTNGIHTIDPNREGLYAEKGGKKLLEVTVEDLRNGHATIDGGEMDISRVGDDGRGGHLCEDAGLEFWSLAYTKLLRVCIAHPRTRRLLNRVFVSNDLISMNWSPEQRAFSVTDYEDSISSIVLKYGQNEKFPPAIDN